MEALYPLQFRPIFRDYLWGGTGLKRVLGKEPDVGPPVAESWEIVDHGKDQSVVLDGPLGGKTLAELVKDYQADLIGDRAWQTINREDRPDQLKGRFPLLFKFLDANRALSVQVHPNDELAAKLDPPDLGKTEAWVVMDAEPQSRIYAGLKEGIGRKELRDAMEQGATEDVLHSFEPEVGDCVFIPAGTVHAIGAGLLIAEIQQASDTTYRMFDWNRVGADGNPRELHIEQAIESVDYERGPVKAQKVEAASIPNGVRLVACDEFILERWNVDANSVAPNNFDDFHMLAVTRGGTRVESSTGVIELSRGQTMLVPAGIPFSLASSHESEVMIIRPGGA